MWVNGAFAPVAAVVMLVADRQWSPYAGVNVNGLDL